MVKLSRDHFLKQSPTGGRLREILRAAAYQGADTAVANQQRRKFPPSNRS
ncbi:MAG: hypothetical protein ACYDIC_03100 [Desulfobaccales bacterium]